MCVCGGVEAGEGAVGDWGWGEGGVGKSQCLGAGCARSWGCAGERGVFIWMWMWIGMILLRWGKIPLFKSLLLHVYITIRGHKAHSLDVMGCRNSLDSRSESLLLPSDLRAVLLLHNTDAVDVKVPGRPCLLPQMRFSCAFATQH